MSKPRKYPEELLERGVRLVLETSRPIAHVAGDLGHPPGDAQEARAAGGGRQRQAWRAADGREREEIRRLRREVFELRRANEILKAASVFFAKELDPDRPR